MFSPPVPGMLFDVFARRRSLLASAALVAGIALLVWQVREVGAARIAEGFNAVGWWGFGAVLALSLLRFLARTVAWTSLIGERVSLGRALAATIGGDAAGNLTPLSLLVSEPTKALYLGGHAVGILGWPEEEALAFLAELYDFATQDRFVYIHKWKQGDLVIWDNRCTLHRATPLDTDEYKRDVRRTTINEYGPERSADPIAA